MSRVIQIRGANFPHSVTVQIVFSPVGRLSPIEATSSTDGKGHLSATLHVPSSPPGQYRIDVRTDGYTQASTSYAVRSFAHVVASAVSGRRGTSIRVSGARFSPGLSLTVVVYPLSRVRPFLLGRVRTDRHGSFSLTVSASRLSQGQYDLRAYSAVAAQTGESFFEVVS